MPKTIPAHLRDQASKCIFCGEPGVTRTHVWPDWLNRLLYEGNSRIEEIEFRDAPNPPPEPWEKEQRQKQGSLFSQKPYLACENCNTGWMHDFEDEMLKFAKPILTGEGVVKLSPYQHRVLVGWLTLITILAQYTNKNLHGDLPISKADHQYMKQYRWPPDDWTIVCASLDTSLWRQKYKMHAIGIYRHDVGQQLPGLVPTVTNNTQVSSFGMGKLFVQVFTCPIGQYSADFRVASKTRGLVQLWPLAGSFWPFPKRPAKFPTKLILKDGEPDIIANAFYDRLKIMTKRRGARER